MFSPLLNIVMQWGAPLLGVVVIGLLSKAYCASKMQSKIRRYQGEIVKSHAKILELEAQNDQLEKRVKDMQGAFVKDRLILN